MRPSIREDVTVPSTEPAKPNRIFARQLYDGMSPHMRADQVIDIADGRIADIRPATADDARDHAMPEFDLVTPGFIDLQINGAADTQFNFDPTPEALRRIAAGAREGGTAYILPTFITAPQRDYVRALEAVQTAITQGAPGILGVHLEGPFLSHMRPGIHDTDAIRSMDAEDLDRLTAARGGVLLLTVAPENLPVGALQRLTAAGIRVFAGHTEATADQMAQAEADGLVGVTHLFNAMSQMTGREPGVVGATLASKGLFAGIIADGHHVDWRNVATAARLLPDRLCLVTDAMLTLAGQLTEFELHSETIELRGSRLTNKTGRLAGAHVSMIESVRNMLDYAYLGLPDALRLATANPARALGLEGEVGSVRPGYRASFTCLTQGFDVAAVITDGLLYHAPG
ncbi:N-acetylglucosamine-6-phosphate deacetylase [Litoreibacter arenae]|uniref:N-acetylglucosamine-6-phosphate deacetylase n=1 Tax=Litoreibacter arenae DSM 19593 TaxID=1123360 RepID=S9QEB0_9RHOB|nr:N-acetylglucosamine-6-phosphate deacetylase [Litoreibacter arenae]EPX78272.1 N-acetylglucosamine-6-phosphate deacetylase [Litoreibacter arenae DSM 19593]